MVLFLAGFPLASSVASRLQNSGYPASSSSQSSRVEGLLSSSLHRPTTQVLVVFHSDLPLTDPAYQRRLQAFLARVRTFPHVVGSPTENTSQDGHSTVVELGFDEDTATAAG